jgi:hypothetical protein
MLRGSPGPLSNILDKGLTIPMYTRDAPGEIENDLGIFWNPIYWCNTELCKFHDQTGQIHLSFDTLTDLSQFFFILSDLKCYRRAFSSFTNILEMQSQRSSEKPAVKKVRFFELQIVFFFSSF